MTNYRQINVNASTFFSGTSDILDSVKKAIAAGETPFIRPSSFFPRNFTLTNQPAYEQFEQGCSNLRARGVLRIEIVHPLMPVGSTKPEQNTDRARVVWFFAKPGETITILDPGVLLRSPTGYFVGISGGQSTKFGVLKDAQGRGAPDSPRVNFGGGFTYTANPDAPVGAQEEVVFLLIDTSGGGFKQPFDLLPYFDPETHPEYCGLNNVPALNKGSMLGFGAVLASALKAYSDKIAFWCAPVNEPEYRVFWPRRWKEADNAPNLEALYDEVYWPFMDGVAKVLWRDAMYAGPDTGSPDVLAWWLGLPRMGRDIVTFHAYSWAGETFPDSIAFKLDNWLKPQLDGAGWKGKVYLTELGDISTGVAAVGQVGGFTEEKWKAVIPIIKARPWITGAFNPMTGLVEEL